MANFFNQHPPHFQILREVYFLKILGMHNKIRKEKDSNGAIKNIRYSDYSNVELYKSVA